MQELNSRYLLRGLIPLALIMVIVLAGFVLMGLRQENLRSLEKRINGDILNAVAKKDLGSLIVGDLRKVSAHFYITLLAVEEERQQQELARVHEAIGEINVALDVLDKGGVLQRSGAEQAVLQRLISYRPPAAQDLQPDILEMQSQLVVLQEQINQTIDQTRLRNLLFHTIGGAALRDAGLEVRRFEKQIHTQLGRMVGNAELLVDQAEQELNALRNEITAARQSSRSNDLTWTMLIVLGVFVFIALIYRHMLGAQRHMQRVVNHLRETESDLRQSHLNVVALNSSLEEQVVERTAELRTSEQQWSDAFNAVHSPLFLHDREGRIIKANQAYLDLAGTSLEEVIGQPYWNLFPRRESPLPGCFEKDNPQEEQVHTFETDVEVDGRTYRSQSFTVHSATGNYLYGMHLLEDYTEKYRVAKALRESEKRFREVINSLDDALILIDNDLKIRLLNDAARSLYWIGNKECLGELCYEAFWDTEAPCENCPNLKVQETGQATNVIRTMPDGRILDRSVSPVHNSTGQVTGCVVIVSDVTERERYFRHLQRLEQIMSTATDLVAFFDDQHFFLAANDVYAEYYKVAPEDVVGKHATEVIGPERYQDYLKFHSRVIGKGQRLSFQTWVDYPRAGRRFMDISFTPYREEDGRISGFVTRSRDLTENYEQQARLKLSAKVFENTTEGIIVTDRNGTILTVNAAFERITRYRESEAVGKTPNLLKSGRHDDAFYRQLWASLDREGQWRGEVWNKRKDGDEFPALLTISSIKDENDAIANYVGVFSDITSLKQAADRLEYQAHHNPLTGLPNRLLLHVRLEHSIQQARREKHSGAVLFIDLDNFKKINDSLGHSAGDEVLKAVAARLCESCREVDTVAHLSGDEFVVVLHKVRSIDDAKGVARGIIDSLRQPFDVEGFEFHIGGSIGIAEFGGEKASIENLLKNADTAMYKAKERGKNRYHLYSPELSSGAMEKIFLENHLHHALKNDELVLHYQPQVSLPSGRVVAMEALVRWDHPELGLLLPERFIHLCEETGLIIPLGEWVLRTACRQLVEWRRQGFELRRIAVNISGKQIQLKDLHRVVEHALIESGLPSGSLELEISEGFIMQHPEQSVAVLQQIRALGVELSIDDFGTGHSSLTYLKQLPVNRLKIDRSFIWDIGENPEGETITRTVIAMGRSLNLQVTAEGVENQRQLDFLQAHGCNEIQGFLFGEPAPAEIIVKRLGAANLLNRCVAGL